MSTTSEVYPGQGGIPTFEQLLARTSRHFYDQLEAGSLQLEPDLCFKLMDTLNHDQCASRHDSLQWADDQYGWFYLGGLTGGIEVNLLTMEKADRDNWMETLDFSSGDERREDLLEECLARGYYWSLRMGREPAAVGLLHGLLAGSLAELTGGFVWSDDGAWDYDRFPATSDELFECFLSPEMAIQPEFRTRALQSWKTIPEQVQTAVSRFSLTVQKTKEALPVPEVAPKAWWRKLI